MDTHAHSIAFSSLHCDFKMTVGTEIASIPRSTTEQAANRAGVKGQRCNTETIDGANIPLTLRGAERSSVQQKQRHERATTSGWFLLEKRHLLKAFVKQR